MTIIPLSLFPGFITVSSPWSALVGDFIPIYFFSSKTFLWRGGRRHSYQRELHLCRRVETSRSLSRARRCANIMNATGAMLMINPLLKATEHRKYRMHTFILLPSSWWRMSAFPLTRCTALRRGSCAAWVLLDSAAYADPDAYRVGAIRCFTS